MVNDNASASDGQSPSEKNVPFTQTPMILLADSRLSSTDKAVAGAITSFAWNRKDTCFPSIEAIGKRASRSVRTVRRSLRNLEYFGYIRVIKNGSLKTGREYVLAWRADGTTFAPIDSPVEQSPRSKTNQKRPRPTPDPEDEPESSRIGAPRPILVGAPRPELAAKPDQSPEPDEGVIVGARAIPLAMRDNVISIDDRDAGESTEFDPETTRTREQVKLLLDRIDAAKSRRAAAAIIAVAGRILAHANLDDHSHLRYCKELWAVANGTRSAASILSAFDQTQGFVAARKVDHLGPYFFGVINGSEAEAALDELEIEHREAV